MTLDPAIIANAARYGHNLKPIIDEITLWEQIPLYGENKRLCDNAKRRLNYVVGKKLGMR